MVRPLSSDARAIGGNGERHTDVLELRPEGACTSRLPKGGRKSQRKARRQSTTIWEERGLGPEGARRRKGTERRRKRRRESSAPKRHRAQEERKVQRRDVGHVEASTIRVSVGREEERAIRSVEETTDRNARGEQWVPSLASLTEE